MPGGSAGFSRKARILSSASTADRDVGAAGHVLLQHRLVVHFIHVVAGQDEHVFRRVALDDVDVLVHRVGGAEIPAVFGHALAGGQDIETFVAFGAEEVPAALQMADQAVGTVLRGHGHAADAGIQRVGEREIDDAQLGAEIDRGLGTPIGQFHQPAAAAAGQHEGHGLPGQRCAAGSAAAHAFLPPWLTAPGGQVKAGTVARPGIELAIRASRRLSIVRVSPAGAWLHRPGLSMAAIDAPAPPAGAANPAAPAH